MEQVASSDVTPDEFRAQVARILASDEMESAPRNKQLLQYLVDEQLAGRGARLKGYTIGLEVFERDASFDPQTDTVVRVQAGRLRRSLELFYARDGAGDDIIVELPRGSYAPVASRRDTGASPAEAEPDDAMPAPPPAAEDNQTRRRRLMLLAPIYVVAACALAIVVGLLWTQTKTSDIISEEARLEGDLESVTAVSGEFRPVVAVVPFAAPSENPIEERLAIGLSRQIVADLARFRHLYVVGINDGRDRSSVAGPPHGVTFIVDGIVRVERISFRITATLIDAQTSGILWSQTYTRTNVTHDLLDIEAEVSRSIATVLGQSRGIVNRMAGQRAMLAQEGDVDAFACVFKFYEYASHKTRAQHMQVRKCLTDALEVYPLHAPAWSALSWVIGDEYRYGFNADPAGNAVERSIAAAERGVSLDPYNSMTRQYLASALFLAPGNDRRVKEELYRAIELNPYNSELLAEAGWTLSVLGEWDVGEELTLQAIELSPAPPKWYRGVLAVHRFIRGKFERALIEAEQYFQEDVLLSHVILTASLAHLGRDRDAEKAAEALLEKFPEFEIDPYKAMQSSRLPAAIVEQLLNGVRLAGVDLS